MEYEFFENVKYLDIAKKEKTSTLVAKAIEAYDLKLDKNASISDPYKYKGMQELVGFILKAINDNKKIMVYGDYDVDGICSVSILKRMFSLMNVNIGYYIPNRYLDGYGITMNKVKEIIAKKYDILICIDNGINAVEELNFAKDNGLDVIILDHHELIGNLPSCDYYLHPIMSEFSSYNMCASSVAYYLSLAILNEDDDKCAILAGIATLSDVMPLIEQNKLLVKNCIKLLNNHRYKNLDLLIDNAEYDENTLTMTLIPKLNSIGRILKDIRVNSVISFLFEDKEDKLLEYSKFILECNEYRKKISSEFYEKTKDEKFNNVIVTKDDTLLEGVCGIIASRFANTYNIPSFVFAKDETGNYYKGSARSIEGINIVEVLDKLDYLVNFGGHPKAAGLTIKIEDYQKFKNDVTSIIKNYKIEKVIKKAILLNEEELNYKSYLELLKYGPFGESNPYPLFGIENVNKDKISFSKDNKHLIIKLNNEVTLLAFNLANKYQEKYNNYRVIFTLDKNNLIKNKLSCKCVEVIGG